jgi:peptidyl carrier protein
MTAPEVTDALIKFVQHNLVTEQPNITIEETTPLLELGVLDSLKTAVLLNFIHGELAVVVPPDRLSTRNFRDIRSIAAVVAELAAEQSGSAAQHPETVAPRPGNGAGHAG